MKNTFFVLCILLFFCVNVSFGQVHVKGYYKSNGTYVQPHYRSNPDGNPYNNWSYPGNVNPYTGKVAPGNSSTYIENNHNDRSSSNNYPNAVSNANGNSINSTYSRISTDGSNLNSRWNSNYYDDSHFSANSQNIKHSPTLSGNVETYTCSPIISAPDKETDILFQTCNSEKVTIINRYNENYYYVYYGSLKGYLAKYFISRSTGEENSSKGSVKKRYLF